MTEFSATIRSGIATLPTKAERVRLIDEAEALKAAIAYKAPPVDVAQKARATASNMLAAYPVPLASAKATDAAQGDAHHAEHCERCSGGKGDGHGARARGRDTLRRR